MVRFDVGQLVKLNGEISVVDSSTGTGTVSVSPIDPGRGDGPALDAGFWALFYEEIAPAPMCGDLWSNERRTLVVGQVDGGFFLQETVAGGYEFVAEFKGGIVDLARYLFAGRFRRIEGRAFDIDARARAHRAQISEEAGGSV